jgi:hypothetical protein
MFAPRKTARSRSPPSAGIARDRTSGRRRHQVGGLASTGDVLICSDCLKLCEEILAEQLD